MVTILAEGGAQAPGAPSLDTPLKRVNIVQWNTVQFKYSLLNTHPAANRNRKVSNNQQKKSKNPAIQQPI